MKRNKGRNFIFSRILLVTGTLLLLIWGVHKVTYFRSLRLSESLLSSFSREQTPNPFPSHIQIGDRINLSIVESGYVNGAWLISETKANHVAKSASPGGSGNIIIYAHNKWNMFGPLRWLSGDEEIKLINSEGKTYLYKVTKVAEVSTEDVSLLQPTQTEVLTLYTCSGFLDSKRYVVRAIPALAN